MSRTRSILKKPTQTTLESNPPFFPSPKWLSESPGRPSVSTLVSDTPYIDQPGEKNAPLEPQSTRIATASIEERQFLRSPAPPPPANLHQGQSAAFSVDPGIPFLATAGPTDAGSDSGSVRIESPKQPTPTRTRMLGGGLIGGLKKAVGSLGQSRKGSQSNTSTWSANIYAIPPPNFRDSGYGDSTPQLVGPSTLPAPVPQNPPPTQEMPAYPPANNHPQPYVPISSRSSLFQYAANTPGPIASPLSLQFGSHTTATIEYGSDYAQMDPETPPPSEVSFNTYLTRAQKFAAKIAALPWVASDRPTVDYYPERSKRRDEPRHAPQIGWHAPDYVRPNFKVLTDEGSDAGTWDSWEGYRRGGEEPKQTVLAIKPGKRHSQVDLGEEFEEPFTPAPPPANSIYGANTPRGSLLNVNTPRMSVLRMATPAQFRQPLPQDPLRTPKYPMSRMDTPAQYLDPLPQDPPENTPRMPYSRMATPAGYLQPLPQDPPQQTPRVPMSRIATPNLYRTPLPQDPPQFYTPLSQNPPVFPPSQNDPPINGTSFLSTPIAQPQPRYSPEKLFQPPSSYAPSSPASDTGGHNYGQGDYRDPPAQYTPRQGAPQAATPQERPRMVSRPSSRGYALYDPPVPRSEASPTPSRSARRMSEQQQPMQTQTGKVYPKTPIMHAVQGSLAPSESEYDYDRSRDISSQVPHATSLHSRSASAAVSPSGQRLAGGWENYPTDRNGYVAYEDAPRAGYYPHTPRVASRTSVSVSSVGGGNYERRRGSERVRSRQYSERTASDMGAHSRAGFERDRGSATGSAGHFYRSDS